MRSDTTRLPLILVALVGGLALFVAGFVIAAEVRSAVASPAAAATGGGCYTSWNGDTCAAGYTAVETGVWTIFMRGGGGVGGAICAAEKERTGGTDTALATTREGSLYGLNAHIVNLEPCAICCASGGAAVGGIGELPPIAGIGGSPSYNYAIAAVLALVAVAAFAAGGWYARRRWLR